MDKPTSNQFVGKHILLDHTGKCLKIMPPRVTFSKSLLFVSDGLAILTELNFKICSDLHTQTVHSDLLSPGLSVPRAAAGI